jgi:hypothetical protein
VKLLHKNAQTGKKMAKNAGYSRKINAVFIFPAGFCRLSRKMSKGIFAQKRKGAKHI